VKRRERATAQIEKFFADRRGNALTRRLLCDAGELYEKLQCDFWIETAMILYKLQAGIHQQTSAVEL
jgi:hypothetical protein